MTVTERNFATFHLGDDVYKLAGGIIPELGARIGVNMAERDEALGALVGQLGPNKVLRDNGDTIKNIIPVEEAAEMVRASGIAEALNRSLWSPDSAAPTDTPYLATGAVANWQDRVAKLLAGNEDVERIHLAVGIREMATATEVDNPHVKAFQKKYGRYPTEAEYALGVTGPTGAEVEDGLWTVKAALIQAGKNVHSQPPYNTKDGAEIASYHLSRRENSVLLSRGFTVARVATGGVQLAIQWRAAARNNASYGREFDTNPNAPQLGILTDGVGSERDSMELAQTEEELKTPVAHQSPYTALRQLAVTAKMLNEEARIIG